MCLECRMKSIINIKLLHKLMWEYNVTFGIQSNFLTIDLSEDEEDLDDR